MDGWMDGSAMLCYVVKLVKMAVVVIVVIIG